MGSRTQDTSEINGKCHYCSQPVTHGITLSVHAGDDGRTFRLCQDCATLECPHCHTSVRVTELLPETDADGGALSLISCHRCEKPVLLSNAVELRQEDDKQYRKRICGECLEQIGVPPGFRVIRDLGPD